MTNITITPEVAMDAASAAKSLSHPIKVEVLNILAAEGEASPSRISEILGETGPSLGNISYHVRQLAELRTIELSHTTPRRGALEHHYKISKQGHSDLSRLAAVATKIETGSSGSSRK